ncbi:hypothetical protein [Butyrivibrio proteoclasticus]|uniref:hypothetical protein n=1 Tax=Butyrivibrio proteoclasticus TaxID=43305 RepID=UPI00047A3B01|nr:hypothetical protein [Butyrivibrio proteoclasticus]
MSNTDIVRKVVNIVVAIANLLTIYFIENKIYWAFVWSAILILFNIFWRDKNHEQRSLRKTIYALLIVALFMFVSFENVYEYGKKAEAVEDYVVADGYVSDVDSHTRARSRYISIRYDYTVNWEYEGRKYSYDVEDSRYSPNADLDTVYFDPYTNDYSLDSPERLLLNMFLSVGCCFINFAGIVIIFLCMAEDNKNRKRNMMYSYNYNY